MADASNQAAPAMSPIDMLIMAVPGRPGQDYPILAEVPETSFNCDGRTEGGYYADQEADCQLFHVCVQVSEYEVRRDFYHIEHGIDILRIFQI